MRLDLPVPEPHFLAVGEEDERHAQLLRIRPRLPRRIGRVGGRPLGLDDRQRPPIAVAQHVVGLGRIRQHVLEPHRIRILDVPALIPDLGVDLDPRKRFVGRHASAPVQIFC